LYNAQKVEIIKQKEEELRLKKREKLM